MTVRNEALAPVILERLLGLLDAAGGGVPRVERYGACVLSDTNSIR